MTHANRILSDDLERRTAIANHDQSILVEAGAGSGKTAVMAGRIASMLAEGLPPKSIAAVTFTELAASELLIRVRNFVSELSANDIPTELKTAFPDGLSESHKVNLAAASDNIDEITCSTIHGFCQRLIKPYPVEADIDPGASVMDRNQADLVFMEIVETWLREHLSGDGSGIIAEMVLHSPGETVGLIHKIVANLRQRRTVSAPAAQPIPSLLIAFNNAAEEFDKFIKAAPAKEEETAAFAKCFVEMAKSLVENTSIETPFGLVDTLKSSPPSEIYTTSGDFRKYRKKGKWAAAVNLQGLAKSEGDRLNIAADKFYEDCCTSWNTLLENIAAHVLADLIAEVQPILERFRDYKRDKALLDFDDLIFAARNLIRDHDDVRRSLAERFSKVLVDEFQDTDPLQSEIFWRLCGEPPADGSSEDWTSYLIRPGALFLVGDPKQAIYRFRGADVGAYVQARDKIMAHDAKNVLSISTNFRSCAPILTYVNERFETLLSSNGQPGFTALDPYHTDRGDAPCVAALDITIAGETGKASAAQKRDGEAEAVADMCARLIGSEMIIDRHSDEKRTCRPGDIALLAPSGGDLWRYEEALERRGIPVATQAGKGFFRRQEIQDLIALTRVLTDRRDTLALGALLRGPLVGLSEEELLDIIWALPKPEDEPKKAPRLDLLIDIDDITHPLAKETLEKLQALYRQTNSTTPHSLISQAVDALRVRPILLERHQGQAERALANVDLYLSMATKFSVRGLRAFTETMIEAWTDKERAVEGRPDAQEEAVALYTMHAAKGLEWPIVFPINTMTETKALESAVTDRDSNTFYCPIFGVDPIGYKKAREAESAELDRERIRLWYVATTRARELLVLPRADVPPSNSSWISLLDLSLENLPALDLSHLPLEMGSPYPGETNEQSREDFAAESTMISERQRQLIWVAPSRDEGPADPAPSASIEIRGSSESKQAAQDVVVPKIQGGRERGLILHKLLEEVLTGETDDNLSNLTDRASILISELGQPIFDDPAKGLTPKELSACVKRTLALPEVAALRPSLVPEYPVYAATKTEEGERAATGILDATSFNQGGTPQVVIDWKSDVEVKPEMLEHYRAQVRTYLEMTGAEKGLIVMVTTGDIYTVPHSTQHTGAA